MRGDATGDVNFVGGGDQITYRVDVAPAQGPFTVQAELLYQPLSYRFVQDMLTDGGESGQAFGGDIRRGRSHAGPRRNGGADAGTVDITDEDSP